MKKNLLTLLLAGLTFTVAIYAKDKLSDEKTELGKAHFEKISYDDLKKAIEEKKVFLVDCNGTESYKAGHIPSAVDSSEKDLLEKAPAEKDALVVSYCGSEKCTAWKSGAKTLKAKGYTNIKHFSGGLMGWKEAGGKLEAATEEKPTK